MVAGYCLEKAKRVLAFHASTLWRATTSDEFEFVCGKIWLIADDISQRLRPLLLSDVLTELSLSDASEDDAMNKETFGDPDDDFDDELLTSTSFRNLSNSCRLVLNQHGPTKTTHIDKTISRPLLMSSRTYCCHKAHHNCSSTSTVSYSNPFDSRLFDGLSRMLKCHLIGSPSPYCQRNLFIERENSIQLVENFLLGYSLFIMVPALTYIQSPCHPTDVCYNGDQSNFKFLNSWKLLLDVMSIPQQVIDKLTSCPIEHIWSWGDSRLSPSKSSPKKKASQGHKNAQRKEPVVSCSQLPKQQQKTHLQKKESLTCNSASVGPQKGANCLCCGEKPCLKTCSQESDTHSPHRKLKRLTGNIETAESGNCLSQQLHGAGDSNLCRLSVVDNETTNNKAPMNPLAEPFVLKTNMSCEEQIMADQYLLNRSFGVDEAIEDKFCPTFFPLMPVPPFAAQIGKVTCEHLKPCGELSSGAYQNCQPSSLVVENTSHSTTHATAVKQSQQTLSAPSTKPVISQQTSMLLNAPSRCAWVPTQPLLLRPVHPVNQAGMMPAPTIISHNMTGQPPQMLVQGPNQMPLYLMQSQTGRPLSNQFSQVCRPMQLPTSFVPVANSQQNQSRVNNPSISNTQAQKDLIKSALEMMKSRPAISGNVQLTPSCQ